MIFGKYYKKKIKKFFQVIMLLHGITPLDVSIPTTLVGRGGGYFGNAPIFRCYFTPILIRGG
jgi:hypothetical protein